MIKEFYFPTTVWSDSLEVDNDALAKACLEKEAKSKGVILSNSGGWQSEDNIFDDPRFFELKRQSLYCCMSCTRDMSVKSKYMLKLINAWANVNRDNDYNHEHSHPGSFLSAVYYVKAPKGCGDFILCDPRGNKPFTEFDRYFENFNEINSSRFTFTPEQGRLLIFPSWAKHYVKPNLSGKERISIAMNFTLTEGVSW